MAVIKWGPSIKGKLEDRGLPVMYLGRAPGHAADTYRFLNVATNRIVTSRDAIWLNKVYGDWKGISKPSIKDTITILPAITSTEEEDVEDEPTKKPTNSSTQLQGQPLRGEGSGTTTNIEVPPASKTLLGALKKLSGAGNPMADTLVERMSRQQANQHGPSTTTKQTNPTMETINAQTSTPGREQLTTTQTTIPTAKDIASFVMVDKFGGDIGSFADYAAVAKEG